MLGRLIGAPKPKTDPQFNDISTFPTEVPRKTSRDVKEERKNSVLRAAHEEEVRGRLKLGELTKSPKLAKKFQNFQLADYFDKQGQRKYRNLSMTFAVKQIPDIGQTFGSNSEDKDKNKAEKKHLSARAYRLATEMIQQDRNSIHIFNQERYQALDPSEKFHKADAEKRSTESLFLELPRYEEFLPLGYTLATLLPVDMARQDEKEERKRMERMNAILMEQGKPQVKKEMWMLRRDELTDVLKAMGVYKSAAGSSFAIGVERSIFCRFILDSGLVDQDNVPFSWALSVFDKMASPVRMMLSNKDGDYEVSDTQTLPLVPMLSKYEFVQIMDLFIKQQTTNENRFLFFQRLKNAVNRKQAEVKYTEPKKIVDGNRRTLQITQLGGAKLKEEPRTADGRLIVSKEMQESNADAHRRRDRLVGAMLVEPEVVQLVERYRGLFTILFECYVDGPDMNFSQFLQFCKDFRITPRLATTHCLLRMFNITACKSWHQPRDPAEDVKVESRPQSPRSPRSSGGKKLRKSQKARNSDRDSGRFSPSDGRMSPSPQLRTSRGFGRSTTSKALDAESESGPPSPSRAPPIRRTKTRTFGDALDPDSKQEGKDFVKTRSEGDPPASPVPSPRSHRRGSRGSVETAEIEGPPPGCPHHEGIDWAEINRKLPYQKTPEAAELRAQLFSQMDNGNGLLSLYEIQNGLESTLHLHDIFDAKKAIMRAFQVAKNYRNSSAEGERDGDFVERKEFRVLLEYLRHYFELWVMFGMLDVEGDGRINAEEFGKAVPKLREWGLDVSVGDEHWLFQEIDADGGGQILFAEFCAWCIKKKLDLGAEKAKREKKSVQADEEEDQPVKLKTPPPATLVFGVAAFAETLIRAVFSYLMTYGNPVQVSTTSCSKMVWLMTYLHSMYGHLQESRKLRSNEGDQLVTESVEDGVHTQRVNKGQNYRKPILQQPSAASEIALHVAAETSLLLKVGSKALDKALTRLERRHFEQPPSFPMTVMEMFPEKRASDSNANQLMDNEEDLLSLLPDLPDTSRSLPTKVKSSTQKRSSTGSIEGTVVENLASTMPNLAQNKGKARGSRTNSKRSTVDQGDLRDLTINPNREQFGSKDGDDADNPFKDDREDDVFFEFQNSKVADAKKFKDLMFRGLLEVPWNAPGAHGDSTPWKPDFNPIPDHVEIPVGMLERCRYTPPPMSKASNDFDVRLTKMIAKKEELARMS